MNDARSIFGSKGDRSYVHIRMAHSVLFGRMSDDGCLDGLSPRQNLVRPTIGSIDERVMQQLFDKNFDSHRLMSVPKSLDRKESTTSSI